MPEFTYLAIDSEGQERKGVVQGQSRADAQATLDARSLFVVRLDPSVQSVSRPVTSAGLPLLSFRKNFSQRQLSLFTRQLATLGSVSPLDEALRTIARQSEHPHVRDTLDAIQKSVVEGRSLADAMGEHPHSFPALYRATIAAGERSGTLPVILPRLALLLERQAALRGKVIAALAYPLIVAVFAFLVVIALMMFVVPRVAEQFDSVGQTLPLLTRGVMGLSGFLLGYWWAIALLLIMALAGLRGMRARERSRLRFDGWLLHIPLIGRLIRDLHAARMARTLATMVASQLPLMDGIALTVPTVQNRVLRRAMEQVVDAIRGGGSLSGALRDSGVFPPVLVYLCASGESAGRLDEMMERAADMIEQEFDVFTSTALSLLEPAIIIVMGLVIAVVILSIMLPVLQLQTMTGL